MAKMTEEEKQAWWSANIAKRERKADQKARWKKANDLYSKGQKEAAEKLLRQWHS
jgi:hypothetical protein